jgi:hypothetical protein
MSSALEESSHSHLLACKAYFEMEDVEILELCESWKPDPYETGPMDFVVSRTLMQKSDEYSQEPELLLEIAANDPRLEERAKDWALAMQLAEVAVDTILRWIEDQVNRTGVTGNWVAARGYVLMKAKRFEAAERALQEASELTESNDLLIRMRAIPLMASERFDEALDNFDGSEIPERVLVLAGLGKLSDASRQLWKPDAPGSEDEGAASTRRELAEMMSYLYSEVQGNRKIHHALTRYFAEKIREAAREFRFNLELGFAVNYSDLVQKADGSYELPIEWRRSFGPALDFTLPADPLTLFEVIGKLPEYGVAEELRPTRNEIDEFLSDLSASVEKLDFGSN